MRILLKSAISLLALLSFAGPASALETCKTGNWSLVSGEPEEKPVQYETEHFAFRWKTGDVNMEDAVSAGQFLEMVWKYFISDLKFPEPYCDTSDKRKANINVNPGSGLYAGPTGDRDMGVWLAPISLKDHWGLAHEFTHALQGSTRSFRESKYTGWLWESHANWMTHQLPEHRKNVHCSELLVNFPHLYYGSTRDRYCNWQFLEFIKDKYGYAMVNDIWANALKPEQNGNADEDPFIVLMRNNKWTIDDLNDEFGEWAMRNIGWDYVDNNGNDQGPVYRANYGSYDNRTGQRALRVTQLVPIDLERRSFAVPSYWAPQRWGYNVVRLIPDAKAKKIKINFRGIVQKNSANSALPGFTNDPISLPPPSSDWRWGIVAIDNQNNSRFSPLMGGAEGELEFSLEAGDKEIYMVVVGTPSSHQKIQWDQAYYSIYRYPWNLDIKGAMPQGFEPGFKLGTDGKHHPNGGGWVANGAKVDASVYVGPYARVLGGTVKDKARIEDHAIVRSGTISGEAIIGAMSIIDNNVIVKDKAIIRTTFLGIGEFERGAEISGTAQIIGDAEVRGGPKINKGVYTGYIDQDSTKDPKQGSELMIPVPEVTAIK